VLQTRFAIGGGPTNLMERKEIGIVMRTCIILHDMIVEDEHDNCELAFDYDIVEGTTPESIVSYERHPCYEMYLQRTIVIRDPKTHASL